MKGAKQPASHWTKHCLFLEIRSRFECLNRIDRTFLSTETALQEAVAQAGKQWKMDEAGPCIEPLELESHLPQTPVSHFADSSRLLASQKQAVDAVLQLRFNKTRPSARSGLRCERVARTPSQPEWWAVARVSRSDGRSRIELSRPARMALTERTPLPAVGQASP
jgi:hypothetical protein